MTNEEVIKSMSTEMLANYLFERGNCCEYCYGICANQDYCSGYQENESVCIKEICKWLRQEQEHECERATEQLEHDIAYKPTFDSEDGSMQRSKSKGNSKVVSCECKGYGDYCDEDNEPLCDSKDCPFFNIEEEQEHE